MLSEGAGRHTSAGPLAYAKRENDVKFDMNLKKLKYSPFRSLLTHQIDISDM